jgi:hypothetical protein
VRAEAEDPVTSDGLLSKAHASTAGVWRREAIHHIRDRCVLTSVKFAARPAVA